MQRLLLATSLVASLTAYADTPAVVPPPPPMQAAAIAGPEPTVNVFQNGPDTVEEFRMNGKLYMVKVSPQGAPAYYLVDNEGKGSLQRVSPNKPPLTPSWVMMTF